MTGVFVFDESDREAAEAVGKRYVVEVGCYRVLMEGYGGEELAALVWYSHFLLHTGQKG